MHKPKILCLHGFAESASVFRIRTRTLRALLASHAELIYLDAPVNIGDLHLTFQDTADTQGAPSDFTNLGWWWKRAGKHIELRGLGLSLALVAKTLEEQGPFIGILGFSQGGCLAAIIAALLQQQHDQKHKKHVNGLAFPVEISHPPVKFVIVAGAFPLDTAEHQALYGEKIQAASLHMMGAYDTVVAAESSQKLMRCFEAPQVFEFEGGHFIPQTLQCSRAVKRFLGPFVSGLNNIV
ncbi:Ovarian cancer-associated protein 2 [Kickxella alabastrina]|uniref:Ovarian cancer-associated protein 2 n=1 Tax=Kickxella alabastrina TaxID=61397 RepID=A0ACC1IPL3_9FUNG|nr:Ovarian cancer-associated protein 2 [Kickxella alabastrina]